MKKLSGAVRMVGVFCALVAGSVGAGQAVASPAVASPTGNYVQTSPYPTAPVLQPVLALTGLSLRSSGGITLIEVDLSVTNYAAFPDSLFAPAPDLPPCGLNTNSSRTWVNIYNAQTNQAVYGFCALTQAKSLTGLWFARPVTVGLPASVYVRLDDRRTGTSYQSNIVNIA